MSRRRTEIDVGSDDDDDDDDSDNDNMMDNNQNISDQIIQKYKKRGDTTVGHNPSQQRKNHNVRLLLVLI